MLLEGGRIVSIAEARGLGLAGGVVVAPHSSSAQRSASPRQPAAGDLVCQESAEIGVQEASPVSVVSAAVALQMMATGVAATTLSCGAVTGKISEESCDDSAIAVLGAKGDAREEEDCTGGASQGIPAPTAANTDNCDGAATANIPSSKGGSDDHDAGDQGEAAPAIEEGAAKKQGEGRGGGFEVARRTEYECMICLQVSALSGDFARLFRGLPHSSGWNGLHLAVF